LALIRKSKKFILKLILSLAALLLVFYAGYGYGVRHELSGIPPAYINNSAEGKPGSVDFALFWQTWNKVRELYNGSSDPQEMVYGAASGMVAALGDPYSVFLKPSDNEALSADLSGQFEGIGAELTTQNGQIVVIAPLPGSPAEKAGIKAKDVILEVDGTSTANMSLNEVVAKIRGKAGTEVKLKIVHAGSDKPIDLTVVRQNIKVDSVTYQVVTISGKKVAILKVSQFGDDTIALANKFAAQIPKDGVSGIILDLRNNPGGYLDSSVTFSNLFIEKGKTVVSEVDKSGAKTVYTTQNVSPLANYPMVVLVNNGSASAAEIVTGAIKDNSRGETIGEKTFGKGSVQQLEPLSGGAALKVTIAKWLTPNGSEINKVGITPDVVVTLSDDDRSAGRDPQLDKAKSELRAKIK